eukprot:1984620-Karenia_brevis.AAC.1
MEAKDAEMSDAAHKKASIAQMYYDKPKSGPKDDQWVLLKVKTKTRRKDTVNDVPNEDATKDGPSDALSAEAYNRGNDTCGDDDTVNDVPLEDAAKDGPSDAPSAE